MGSFIDLAGKKFGRLTVIELSGKNGRKELTWRCVCECGNKTDVLGVTLRRGDTRSCGCLHKAVTSATHRTHGMTKTPIYAIWRSMMARCHNKNAERYADYGGRGIIVCDRWHSFDNFFADMGEKPEGMSLEREDNNGSYCPGNVQWKTAKAQANNRRSNVLLTYKGETKTMQQWCDEIGLKIGTVWARINVYGYSVERALTPAWRAR